MPAVDRVRCRPPPPESLPACQGDHIASPVQQARVLDARTEQAFFNRIYRVEQGELVGPGAFNIFTHRFNLARLHAMAYALKTDTTKVWLYSSYAFGVTGKKKG